MAWVEHSRRFGVGAKGGEGARRRCAPEARADTENGLRSAGNRGSIYVKTRNSLRAAEARIVTTPSDSW